MVNAFSAIFVLPALAGLFILVFAEQIKMFVNKLDPLRIHYTKKYFVILGITLMIISLLMMVVVSFQ